MTLRYALTLTVLSAIALCACGSRPPAFSLEPACVAALPSAQSRSIQVGSTATPPPGTYRSARVYSNGYVELNELITYNGPGPWLKYSGQACIAENRAKNYLTLLDGTPPGSAPDDKRQPCVLAFDTATGKHWQGCAYATFAAELLAGLPPLAEPAVAAGCRSPVCQIRLSREVPPRSHERYGEIVQDAVLDADGTFWCAKRDQTRMGSMNMLHVDRGHIAKADAPHVFEWLIGDAGHHITSPSPPALSDKPVNRVRIRAHNSGWTPVGDSAAAAANSRWMQIASAMPAACDPTR